MFIGRERELSSLEKLYRSDKFEFAVVYGRRRVGKTALLSHFIKDKNSIYFMGIESNAKQNLENFSRSILESDSRNPAESVFLTFQSALEYVFRRSEQERIILVIDEYPYVARSSKSFSSVLQLLIDQYKDRSKLMLIFAVPPCLIWRIMCWHIKPPCTGDEPHSLRSYPLTFLKHAAISEIFLHLTVP